MRRLNRTARPVLRSPLAAAVLLPALVFWAGARAAHGEEGAAKRAVKKPDWTITGSLRLREEVWDWFGTETGEGRYAFTGGLLRAAAARITPDQDTVVEMQQTGLFGLPRHATLPAPQGQLGLGAAYYDASGSQQFGLALKQAFIRLKDPKNPTSFLRGGRFEFVEGAETVPADPSLAYLKRERIAHRLIGNFGWSAVGRSFDGLQFSQGGAKGNVTLFGGIPTSGAFDQKANDEIEGVAVGYGALTATGGSKRASYDARLFGAYYEDRRPDVVKTDNRPAAVRSGDRAGIRIETIGGHYLRGFSAGASRFDTLLWGAYQSGTWGTQSHEARAYAAELGWQLPGMAWRPWIRAGYYEASGDGDPSDSRHATFFPMLPTPRIYARFPFYSEQNLKDLWAQIILRPSPKLTTRLDFHKMALASPLDLWYSGGGAFQEKPSFGYAGRPSGGFGSLATLLDLSVDYQLRRTTAVSFYVAHAQAGNVVRSIYPGRDATFAYLELTERW
jgi:hypothetical protein